MNNAEKYPNTKDALEAWRMYGDKGGNEPFDLWLSLNADVVPESTLLEAAEKLIMGFVNNWSEGWSSMECLENLREAVKREKAKPVRNCDRYKTAKEAIEAFDKMFLSHCWSKCNGCPIGEQKVKVPTSNCMFLWLYAEAEKEVTEK